MPAQPWPTSDLAAALIDAARVLARAALNEMPSLGRLEVNQLLRHPEAQMVVMVNVGAGTAELVAFASGNKPIRAPLAARPAP